MIKPSRQLLVAMWCLLPVLLAASWFNGLHWLGRCTFFVGALLTWSWSMKVLGLWGQAKWTSIRYLSGAWWLCHAKDGWQSVQLQDASWVHPKIILWVSREKWWRWQYLVLPRDALTAEGHRRLRVWLLWQFEKSE